MPKIITDASERQANPIFRNKKTHHNNTMSAKEHAEMSEKQQPFQKPTMQSKAPPERT